MRNVLCEKACLFPHPCVAKQDKSGFIRKSEFTPVCKECLKFILKNKSGGTHSGGTHADPHGGVTPAGTPAGNFPPANSSPVTTKNKKSFLEKCCPCCPCVKKKK